MPAPVSTWTVEMLDAREDDGQRYEIIDGELFVTPSPSSTHQHVVGEFFAHLREYLRPARLARALIAPADVRADDRSRNRVQPDVFVVRLVDGKHPAYPFRLDDLLLAIEVESPGNPHLDYQVKRALYLTHGVPEYWVVNPDARIVSRFRTLDDPGELFSQHITWQAPGAPNQLRIDLKALFDEVFG